MEKNGLDVPVVLFFFLRAETTLKIIGRIREVQPKKLYLFSDGGRNEKERELVLNARRKVEEAIDWECEIIKRYEDVNRGVHYQIGLGAKWVFSREENAIFLEDDNLPEITFFKFASEMLEKYKDDERVLWVCGTNYLEKITPMDNSSYVFTKHLMPCGWASWGRKFNKFYDDEIKLLNDPIIIKKTKNEYTNKKLYKQQLRSLRFEKYRVENGERAISWDYHMAFSIRANGLYGICPCNNQIENIGVDKFSTHGGTSFNKVMTRRFCGIKSYPLEFPLKHPSVLLPDANFEKRVAKIILYPFNLRLKSFIIRVIKRMLGIHEFQSIRKRRNK